MPKTTKRKAKKRVKDPSEITVYSCAVRAPEGDRIRMAIDPRLDDRAPPGPEGRWSEHRRDRFAFPVVYLVGDEDVWTRSCLSPRSSHGASYFTDSVGDEALGDDGTYDLAEAVEFLVEGRFR